jgi:protein TonB
MFLERLRSGAGRRTLAIALALLIEALLLLALLTLGADKRPGKKGESLTLVDLAPTQAPEESPEPNRPEPAEKSDERPVPKRPPAETPLPAEPSRPEPAVPAVPVAPPVLPAPAVIPRNAAPPAPAARKVYGPPDKGGSPAMRDSERVGTAPNGEPLYAAAWYREPEEAMLRGYLSAVRGPAWGLIACRTVPNYRVEDCVGLDEYPRGSQIMQAVLAAAWEFRVRPARLGGRPQVGSWVRIRIDYTVKRR